MASDVLRNLAVKVKTTIDDLSSKGEVVPEQEIFFRWKLDRFQYTDKGIIDPKAHGEYITEKSWVRATSKVMNLIKESSEYDDASKQIVKILGRSDLSFQVLDCFIQRVAHGYLCNSGFGESQIDAIIEAFCKNLVDEPVKYGTEVELDGIVLRPDRIKLGDGITLRKTRPEDLERETLARIPLMRPFLSTPSAILGIELLATSVNRIQENVERSTALLRLFKVGSVKHSRYRMYSDSITDMLASGTIFSRETGAPLESYLVTEADLPRLSEFWKQMSTNQRIGLFQFPPGDDHISIAYSRYSDSLLQDGVFERRIMNAVMGLEALFLGSRERGETSYRLSLRVGRLLGLLGHDPHKVKNVVRDSYRVRSSFVHGGFPSDKEKRRMESKYQNIKNLLKLLLDYLRISIIFTMLSDKEKSELVALIDHSFVDRKKEELLNAIVLQAKSIVLDEDLKLLEDQIKVSQEV